MKTVKQGTGPNQKNNELTESAICDQMNYPFAEAQDSGLEKAGDKGGEAPNQAAKDWEAKKEAWQGKIYSYVMDSVKELSAELGIEFEVDGYDTSEVIGNYLGEIEEEEDLGNLTQENLMMHNPLYAEIPEQVSEDMAEEILDAFSNYFNLYWDDEQSLEYEGEYLERIYFVMPLGEFQDICSS